MAINTIDAVHQTAAEASKQKQDGNGLAYLLKNNETARALGAAIDGQAGIIQSISRGIASVFETVARPQNLSKAKNMGKNIMREVLPHQDTHGNRKAPQLQRYASKHQHGPHRTDVEKENIQSSYSDGMNKSDKRTTKARKLLTHSTITKPLKIMGNAFATPFHALADIGQRRQKQEMRHMVRGTFTKADRTHTRRTWKRLTSRDYRDTGSSSPTSSSRTSRWSGKHKKKSSDTQSAPQPQPSRPDRDDAFATNQPSSKNQNNHPPSTTEIKNTEKKNTNPELQQKLKANDENKEKPKDITKKTEQNKNPKPKTQAPDPEITKNQPPQTTTNTGHIKTLTSLSSDEITGNTVRENPNTIFVMGNKKNNAHNILNKEKNTYFIDENDLDFDDVDSATNTIKEQFKNIVDAQKDGKTIQLIDKNITDSRKTTHKNADKIKNIVKEELQKIT